MPVQRVSTQYSRLCFLISFVSRKFRLLVRTLAGFKKNLAVANLDIKFTAKDISKKTHILMEENSSLGRIEAASVTLKIGAYSFFRSGIVSSNLSIGRFCSLGENIHIGVNAQAHPTDWVSSSPFQYDQSFKNTPIRLSYTANKSKTFIGNGVWIGEGVLIMEGVRIGDGAIVAARAVVSQEVKPYTIVGGIPARAIRERFPESLAQELLDTQWWNYPLDTMVDFSFNKPQDFVTHFNLSEIRITNYKVYSVVREKRNLKIRESV